MLYNKNVSTVIAYKRSGMTWDEAYSAAGFSSFVIPAAAEEVQHEMTPENQLIYDSVKRKIREARIKFKKQQNRIMKR